MITPNTVSISIVLHVNIGQQPVSWSERVSNFVDECRERGIDVQVEGPSIDELDAALDELERELARLNVRQVLADSDALQKRITAARGVNELLRKVRTS